MDGQLSHSLQLCISRNGKSSGATHCAENPVCIAESGNATLQDTAGGVHSHPKPRTPHSQSTASIQGGHIDSLPAYLHADPAWQESELILPVRVRRNSRIVQLSTDVQKYILTEGHTGVAQFNPVWRYYKLIVTDPAKRNSPCSCMHTTSLAQAPERPPTTAKASSGAKISVYSTVATNTMG